MDYFDPCGNHGQYNFDPGYGRPRKPTFSEKIRYAVNSPQTRPLMLCGMFVGLGFDIFIVLSAVYARILGGIPELYELYLNNEVFKIVCEMLYSLICVALAFVPTVILINKFVPGGLNIPTGRPTSFSKAFLLIIAGMGICYIGNIVSGQIANFASAFGIEFFSYSQAVEAAQHEPYTLPLLILSLVHTALIPAFVEEFVFRGIVMQPLRKYGDWFAIVTTAFLFGLMHGNMSQVPFAIIAGTVLGYVATVTNSIWPSVILHFLNNAVSVIYSQLLSYTADGEMTVMLSLVVVYGIIAVGVVAAIFYVLSTKSFMRLYPTEVPGLRKRAKYFLTMPTLLFGMLYLFIEVVGDINFV